MKREEFFGELPTAENMEVRAKRQKPGKLTGKG